MPSLRLPTRPRVLIADDHAEMLERIRAVLAAHFEVLAAVADGQAAVDAAARLEPDVVVLDISMPVLNGFDAARQILSGDRQPRVVFLSVHEDVESRAVA